MINIPNRQTKAYVQANESNTLGSVWSTFNAELSQKKGSILANRSKLVFNSDDDADFGIPMAAAIFDYNNDLKAEYVVACEGGGIFWGGANPSDTFTEDTYSLTPILSIRDRIDMSVFNSKLYVSDTSNIKSLEKGGTSWTAPVTSLTTGLHILRPFADRMYFTEADNKIRSFNTAETVATSGSYTLDVGSNYPDLEITCMEAGTNSIWVGTVNQTGDSAYIFEWDGVTSDTPDNAYRIDTYGVLACVIKDNLPYFIDVEGRLLGLNGSSFVEIDRLPIDKNKALYDLTKRTSSTLSDRDTFIRHNGMALIDGNINMLIHAEYVDGTHSEKFPSGIYEYTPQTGLYHKNSVSYSNVSGTTATDYGQSILDNVGCLMYANYGNSDSDRNGRYLFGASYFTDATSTKTGLFIDDTKSTTKKSFELATPLLFASQVSDAWTDLIIRNQPLLNSTDKIIASYRTDLGVSVEGTITWITPETITTTADLSNIEAGDEMFVLQGNGAGMRARIDTITDKGGSYRVTFKSNFLSATGTSKARFTKWREFDCFETQGTEYKILGISKEASQIQFKINGEWTNENEIYELSINNKTDQQL